MFLSYSKEQRELGTGGFLQGEIPDLFPLLVLTHRVESQKLPCGSRFYLFLWKGISVAVSMHFFFNFFFLLVFVATSDGNLYPHASHLKYINVGESVGFQMSSALTLRIKHFSLCSSLSHSLREGQSAACCRHRQPFLCLFSGLLQTAPSQHKQIIIKFSASHPTPASPRGEKKQSFLIFRWV